MPATKKAATARRTGAKTTTARGLGKTQARAAAATTPRLGKRTHAKQIKERLHGAIRRSPQSVSESELEATTVAVLAVVAELAAETAAVFGEVLARIETLERRLAR